MQTLLNQRGIVPILVLVASLGALAFLVLASSADFKDKLFGRLYQRTPSQAAISAPVSGPINILNVSCSGSTNQTETGVEGVWKANITGGTGSYLVGWIGDDGLTGNQMNISKIYTSPGPKNATLTVTSGDQTKSASCKILVVGVTQVASTIATSSLSCPKTYNFSGSISTNGPTTVTYNWLRSDGATSPNSKITFNAAGSQTVTGSWSLSTNDYLGWVQLKIISPIPILSNQATFTNRCYQRVFVSSDTTAGNMGGIGNANFVCQNLADNAKLGGKWLAWLSDNTTATNSKHTKFQLPYKRMDGQLIANNWLDLVDGKLLNPIDLDQNKKFVDSKVWTGSKADGSAFSNDTSCGNWLSNSSSDKGRAGLTNKDSADWTSKTTESCNNSYRIYCIEQ